MALLDQHWLHVVFRSIRLLHAASMTAFFQKIRSKLGICLHWLWFICMFHISMSLGVINMNSIHSCCRFHHWLGWASLPMCLVVSTWGSLQMHRRYILKIRRGKQLNKIKQVFFCVYTDLTLFSQYQSTLVGVLHRLHLWCTAGRANHLHGSHILHTRMPSILIIIIVYSHCTQAILGTCPFKILSDHLPHIDARATRCSNFRSCRARQKGGHCR